MSRNIILCMAMSLDGFIADKKGNINWISYYENRDIDLVNEKFLNQVDTAIMGRKTYEKIYSQIALEEWGLNEIKCYVATKKHLIENKQVEFINDNTIEFIRHLKSENGKDIWVVGGAEFAQNLISEGLIDEFHITIVPIVLGEGIELFKDNINKTKLHLDNCGVYDELILLQYSKS